jgi:hypothetical protein
MAVSQYGSRLETLGKIEADIHQCTKMCFQTVYSVRNNEILGIRNAGNDQVA